MPTHPLWRPSDQPDAEQVRAARVSPDDADRRVKAVVVCPYDPAWPTYYERVAAVVRDALGPAALAVNPRRHVAFRDWLIGHADDREAYGRTKQQLAGAGFTDVADYNNAKATVIYELYERIFAADPDHRHDPRPGANT